MAATAPTIWSRSSVSLNLSRYSFSLNPICPSVCKKRPSVNSPNSSWNARSWRMADVCMSRVTVKPRRSASAEKSTLRDSEPITSFSNGVCNASPIEMPAPRLRLARSNSTAASCVEKLLSPAETALLPDPKLPEVMSPMPHNANPPARKIRNAFMMGDFAPSRIDFNMSQLSLIS